MPINIFLLEEKMRKIKKWNLVIAAMALIAIGLFAGCTKRNAGTKTRIGYVCCNINDTYQTYVIDHFKAFFTDKPEYELIVVDSQEDVIRQQDLVNTLLSQGVKVLIVIPSTTDSVGSVIDAARTANVPVVFLNRNPFGDETPPENTYYIGSDTVFSGRIQAEYAGKLLNGKGNVGILQGMLSQEAARNRTLGNEDVFARDFPNIKILTKEPANWQRDQGVSLTENWLTAYGKEINAILANNDEMALGAIAALRTAGRNDILVFGIDGIPDAIAAIKAGTMAGSAFLDPAFEGGGVAELAYNLITGKPVKQVNLVAYSLITKENVSEFE
jgi:inositol transport system substrate-binding protein